MIDTLLGELVSVEEAVGTFCQLDVLTAVVEDVDVLTADLEDCS